MVRQALKVQRPQTTWAKKHNGLQFWGTVASGSYGLQFKALTGGKVPLNRQISALFPEGMKIARGGGQGRTGKLSENCTKRQ